MWSGLRARSASASASRVCATLAIWGTAWTVSPGSSMRSYVMRVAKWNSANTSASAVYGLPTPGWRGVSWLPLMTTQPTPCARICARARWARTNERYDGRGWSKMSPSQMTSSGSCASARSIERANDSSKSISRRLTLFSVTGRYERPRCASPSAAIFMPAA